jgi:hypothetical protein
MSRPRLKLDLRAIEAAAAIGCTQEEIGFLVGCSDRTLQNREDCREAIAKGSASMKTSLRRMQWKKASEGNVAMLIWLGKQILGQKERSEETIREEVVEIERIAPKSE